MSYFLNFRVIKRLSVKNDNTFIYHNTRENTGVCVCVCVWRYQFSQYL